MKKVFIYIILLSFINSFAIKIGNQDICIGDNILSLDENFFNIDMDSVGYYKIIASNKIGLNIGNGFKDVFIEATPLTGTIYSIFLGNKTTIGFTVLGQEIDSMKSFFNNNANTLNSIYGLPDYNNDSLLLPSKSFINVKNNSTIGYTKNLTKIFLSIHTIDYTMYVKLIYIEGNFEDKLQEESLFYSIYQILEQIEISKI